MMDTPTQKAQAGNPHLLGATPQDGGTNIAFHAGIPATAAWVCIYDAAGNETKRFEITERSAEHVFHGFLPGVNEGDLYGLRVDGPWKPEEGHWFNPNKLLVDPRALAIEGQVSWKDGLVYPYDYTLPDAPDDKNTAKFTTFDARDSAACMPKARVVNRDKLVETMGGPMAPRYKLTTAPILEVHPKGVTKLMALEEGDGVPGTYSGMRSKRFLNWLKDREIKFLQIMPVHYHVDDHRLEQEGKVNYWGYMTLGFFAPHNAYATPGMRPEEDLALTLRALREAGIDVIMDVVYNHTAEGGLGDPMLSFRGLDNHYYRLVQHDRRHYHDTTGCGNSIDTTHPQMRKLIYDSMEFWANGVAGFRFDLGAAMARGTDGTPGVNYKLFHDMESHPILGKCHRIMEAWDAVPGAHAVGDPHTGLVGKFNDKFREEVRAAALSDEGIPSGKLVDRLSGSTDIMQGDVTRSINYITCHDGATLIDETLSRIGKTLEEMESDPEVQKLVQTRMQFAVALLMVSQGVPFLTLGHARGKSQNGNHNAYDDDSPNTWVQWDDLKEWQRQMGEFTAHASKFRRESPEFQRETALTDQHYEETGRPQVTWLNKDAQPMNRDEWDNGRCFAQLLAGRPVPAGDGVDVGTDKLVLINDSMAAVEFTLPRRADSLRWVQKMNSSHIGGRVEKQSEHAGETTIMVPPHTLIAFEGGRYEHISLAHTRGTHTAQNPEAKQL